MGRREHSFLSIPLNLKFSFPLKLGGIGGNEIRINEFFTKPSFRKEGIEWNEMKMNKKNNFKIFFHSMFWEF